MSSSSTGEIEFLSTPSARRATDAITSGQPVQIDFYPRPPRGGRRHAAGAVGEGCKISIHALREEGDQNAVSPTPAD